VKEESFSLRGGGGDFSAAQWRVAKSASGARRCPISTADKAAGVKAQRWRRRLFKTAANCVARRGFAGAATAAFPGPASRAPIASAAHCLRAPFVRHVACRPTALPLRTVRGAPAGHRKAEG